MRKMHRGPAPDWLIKNYKKWGFRYEKKRNDPNKKDDFYWATYDKKRVNSLLLPILIGLTSNHCTYCDGYPMNRIGYTVDHFRPSSEFPLLVYAWPNLFLCCSNCQQKSNFFDKRILKPDKIEYRFNFYFRFSYSTGMIYPNIRRSEKDVERAVLTIKALGFNDFGRPEDRLEVLKKYRDSQNPNIDQFSYRFILI